MSSSFPPLARRMLLCAWGWCALGVLLGLSNYLAQAGTLPAHFARGAFAHRHVLLVGFLLQWIFAIAFWIYPGRRDAFELRAAASAWWLLNLGTLLRAAGETAGAVRPSACGAVLQGGGALLFIVFVAIRRIA